MTTFLTARIAAALTACLLIPGLAQAQEPNLIGTWVATSGVIRTAGGADLMIGPTSRVEIVVADQNGPVFSGSYGWAHPESMQHMHDGEKVTNESVEAFVGVIHADGKTVTLVDSPDTGAFLGTLTQDNVLDIVIYESGPYAIAGRLTLERQ